MKTKKEKTKRQLVVHEVTPVLPIAGQTISRYFEGYVKFFAVRQHFYFWIP
jgi:hypothetical protein